MLGVVIANLHNQRSVRRLDRMKFVVSLNVAFAQRDLRKPFPCHDVIQRFGHAYALFSSPKLFARIKKPSVGERNRPVRTVYFCFDS